MKNQVDDILETYLGNEVTDIRLLATVSKTMSQVTFYGTVNGKRYQSNDMIEKDLVNSLAVEAVYNEITKLIRQSQSLTDGKLGVLKYDKGDIISMEFVDNDYAYYKIRKNWVNEHYNS